MRVEISSCEVHVWADWKIALLALLLRDQRCAHADTLHISMTQLELSRGCVFNTATLLDSYEIVAPCDRRGAHFESANQYAERL